MLAGLIFGLSYLTRPEGFLIYILMIFWIIFFPQPVLKNNQAKKKKSLVVRAFSLGFFIFALPYLLFIKKELGYCRIAWTVVGFCELERIIGRKWGNYVFLFLILPSIFYFSYKSMTKKYDLEHKEAGIWLKNNMEKSSVVMSRKPYVAFYPGNLIASIPEGSYEDVTIYGKKRKADYLVIDQRYIPTRRPELKFLLKPSSVPEELEMVYQGGYGGKRIIIHRWIL